MPKFTPKRGSWAWASTLWPLILHCVLAIGITALMTFYVNDRHFHVRERRPEILLANRTRVRLSQYEPLQSDVVTFLSGTLVTLRAVAASWTSALLWRGVFLLMEKPGLPQRDLEWVISFGVFTPLSYCRNVRMFKVGAILLVTLSAQVVSPILTGSIAWMPSSRLIRIQTDDTVRVWGGAPHPYEWDLYIARPETREWSVRRAVGDISLAWGRSTEKGVMKRAITSIAGLDVNSTITNVTLPYFSVTAFEWVSNPSDSLPPEQLNTTNIGTKLGAYKSTIGPLQQGVGVLIPDTPWTATPFPSPSIVSETRTLAMLTHIPPWREGCTLNNTRRFGRLPSTMGFLLVDEFCFVFARVTYSAGAGLCKDCRVSSYSTVQNDTPLLLQDSLVTAEALRLMPDISVVLVQMNPSFSTDMGNIDDYVTEVLRRSYAGAWSALTYTIDGLSPPLTSSYSPSIPSLQAQLDLKRVYAWLTIQLLVSLSGALFLWMQCGTEYPLIGDTTLAAFELDTTELAMGDERERLKAGGLLKLELRNNELKVVVQDTESVERSVPVGLLAVIRYVR